MANTHRSAAHRSVGEGRRTVREEAGASPRADARRPRLQLEFSPEAYQRLQDLKEVSGLRTNAEVIRKALHVLDWVLTKSNEGYRIQLAKGDSVREVELVI